MTYVDAGYAIALVVLALYAAGLVSRRRRLERAARAAEIAGTEGAAATPSTADAGALTGLAAAQVLPDVRNDAAPPDAASRAGGAAPPRPRDVP